MPKIIENIDELRLYINDAWGLSDYLHHDFEWTYGEEVARLTNKHNALDTFLLNDLYQAVVDDIQGSFEASRESMIDVVRSGTFDLESVPTMEDIQAYEKTEKPYSIKLIDLFYQATYWWADFQITKFIASNKGRYFRIFTYGNDRGGHFSQHIECSGILECFPHLFVSNH